MDPPVSEPRAAGTMRAATATADPPDEPPGTQSLFHGFRVVARALFSVLLPMANSSRFVLPMMTPSAALSFWITSASYGAWKSSSIFDPQVVVPNVVHMLSFTASGTPASGPR